MDSFNKSHFRELLGDTSHSCVSIYSPTYVAAPDHRQNRVALRNLLRQAETRMSDMGESASGILYPAWKLVEDSEFWKGRSAGLAIFASPIQFRAFRVPIQLSESVEVNERFALRPLFPLLTNNSPCLILAISRNLVRLFKATRYEIRDITPTAMPTDLKSTLNIDQVDRGSQTHSATHGSARGKQSAVFHGHGGHADTIKQETAQFFRLVDARLRDLGADRDLPLILAGVEADLALFRLVSHHAHAADMQIHGNLDHLQDHEVHERALPAITELSSSRQTTAISQLRGLNGARVAYAIRDILPAIHQGRVGTLFVRGAERHWGTFFPDSRLVQLHATRQPGDEDLLELAAVETASHGGTVFSLESDELLGESPIAAIYRY